MTNDQHRVCPAELAGSLDNRVRRWFQNPRTLLAPHVREGATVMDVGCGPGFFTVELARLVGPDGRVIAVDLQQAMLDRLADKIRGTDLAARVRLVKCEPSSLNTTEPVDVILAFYMVHEVPDQGAFFRQLVPLLREPGKVLLVEPKFGHVSRAQFQETLRCAEAAGLAAEPGPSVLLSWSAVLRTIADPR